MNYQKWLLTDEEFDLVVGSNYDWGPELLLDNGIICSEWARSQIICSISKYDAPNCPVCGAESNTHYPINVDLWKCVVCLNKFTITSGRYIDNTKLPLTHWWRFCWIAAKFNKLNSIEISKDLGVTQKTAWTMIATLRNSMKDNNVSEYKDIFDVMILITSVKNKH